MELLYRTWVKLWLGFYLDKGGAKKQSIEHTIFHFILPINLNITFLNGKFFVKCASEGSVTDENCAAMSLFSIYVVVSLVFFI